MLDHVGITVSDYDRAKGFYEPVLGTLGHKMQMEPAPFVSGWGPSPTEPAFWISTGCPTKATPTLGPAHVAFTAKTRKDVDAFYEAALKAGAKCNGKPGIRAEYHPNYYGAFVYDLDGHNIEAVCHMAE
jgi:catechol 2,3-dioxygenase-like lactoylglutathione lyase family enzyme